MTINIDQFMAVWYPNQSRAVTDAMRRDLQTLVAQARAQEREACARVCDDKAHVWWDEYKHAKHIGQAVPGTCASACAASIRARTT